MSDDVLNQIKSDIEGNKVMLFVELYTFPLIITDPHPRNFRHAWTFKNLDEPQLLLYLQEFKRRIENVIQSFQPDVIECQHLWLMRCDPSSKPALMR